MNESFGLRGWVRHVVRDSNGKVKEVREGPNLVVTDGKEEVARLICDVGSPGAFTHIALGTGSTAPAAGQTSLADETHRSASTESIATTAVTNDTAQFLTTFSFTSSNAIVESGVFNDPSAGDMLCRQTFSAINVGSGDTLETTWKIQVS